MHHFILKIGFLVATGLRRLQGTVQDDTGSGDARLARAESKEWRIQLARSAVAEAVTKKMSCVEVRKQ